VDNQSTKIDDYVELIDKYQRQQEAAFDAMVLYSLYFYYSPYFMSGAISSSNHERIENGDQPQT
jgi:hypothetical protein